MSLKPFRITKSITPYEDDCVKNYFFEVAKYDSLTQEEELALIKRIREDKDKIAYEKLIHSNLKFVISVAKKYQGQGVSFGDLINEGNIGLIKAIDRFEEDKGFRFISYAVWWIRSTISLAIAGHGTQIRIPANRIGDIKKMKKISQFVEQNYHCDNHLLDEQELSEITGVSIEDIRATNTSKIDYISLNGGEFGEESFSNIDSIINEDSKESDYDLQVKDEQFTLTNALKKLTQLECDVLVLNYGLFNNQELNLQQIADRIGLDKDRVKNLRNQSYKKIRKIIE